MQAINPNSQYQIYRANRAKVKACIEQQGAQSFTVSAIAEAVALPVSSVRGFFNGLHRSGFIAFTGWVAVRYESHNGTDAVKTYTWTGKTGPLHRVHRADWETRRYQEYR